MKAEVIAFLFATGIGGFGSHLITKEEPPPAPSETILPGHEALKPSNSLSTDNARTFADSAGFYEWLGSASATELERTLRRLFREPGEFQSEKWQQIDTILRQLASIDPERALDLINKHWVDRHGSLRDKRRMVLGIWARTDVVAAVDRALAIDPEAELLPLFEPLPTEKAEQLYKLLTERGLDRSPYFGNLMASDENVSPAVATERVLANKNERWRSRDYALGMALGRWHKEDQAAAMAWLDDLENPRTKERANLALAQTRLQTDGLTGLEVLLPQLTPQGKQQLFQDFGRAVRGQNIEKVIDWLDNNVKSPTAL